MYAGAIAIPVHQRLAPRIATVVPDSRPRFVVANAETQSVLRPAVDTLADSRPRFVVATATAHEDAGCWEPPNVDPAAVAMLQYTSGSTRTPKGVVLTHRNLLSNLEIVRQAWGGDDTDVCAFWLPQHHDMGLIGGILTPLYMGCTTHLMSPSAFVKRPLRWLEVMSRHCTTHLMSPSAFVKRPLRWLEVMSRH
ncbi:AMP-binding protein, partial [Mycolicibacterium hippocampi]|uniref:AMP-binding protein n=1 Tax=Mycolicibacterium hippocampi TaxID=659824 RepID=UPI0021F2C6FC